MAMRVTSQSRAQTTALYLASQKIEEIRNLPYEQIKTIQESITADGINYDIQIIVEFVDDCADGTIEGLDCDGESVPPDAAPDDYKKVQVKISWEELWGGEKVLSTRIASGRLETGEGMGGLRILVSDSTGTPLEIDIIDQFPPCPLSALHIKNDNTGLDQCFGTDPANPGSRLLILEASSEPDDYKIRVQKQDYAFSETFKAGDLYNETVIASPDKKNPTINEGELYLITFIIDPTSELNIITAAPWGGGSFFNNFLNQDKIIEINNLEIAGKEVFLAESSPGFYYESGSLTSAQAAPEQITEWYQFSWFDFQEPETGISYQLWAATSTEWFLVPDDDLPGNSEGLIVSPADLSALDIEKYPKLRAKANFSTTDTTKTPFLYQWQISWKDGEATPISDVKFSLYGEKTVGTDEQEAPIYKYLDTVFSNADGEKFFSQMETDNYYFYDFSKDNNPLSLDPELSPMPVVLLPATTTEATLYLKAENSLLIKVQDADTGELIFGAAAELVNSAFGYSQTQNTNREGEALFIPLEKSADYDLTITAENYYQENFSVSVEGETFKQITLERYE